MGGAAGLRTCPQATAPPSSFLAAATMGFSWSMPSTVASLVEVISSAIDAFLILGSPPDPNHVLNNVQMSATFRLLQRAVLPAGASHQRVRPVRRLLDVDDRFQMELKLAHVVAALEPHVHQHVPVARVERVIEAVLGADDD